MVLVLFVAGCAPDGGGDDDIVEIDGAVSTPTGVLCNQVPEVRCTTSQTCWRGHCYPCGRAGATACQTANPDAPGCDTGTATRACYGVGSVDMCMTGIPAGFGGPGQMAFTGYLPDGMQAAFCVYPARCTASGLVSMCQ